MSVTSGRSRVEMESLLLLSNKTTMRKGPLKERQEGVFTMRQCRDRNRFLPHLEQELTSRR